MELPEENRFIDPIAILRELVVTDDQSQEEKPLLTKKEVKRLAEMRYQEEDGDLIIKASDRDALYVVVSLLLEYDFASAMEFFDIVKDRRELIFFNPLMSVAREQAEVQDELLRNKPLRLKSGYKCRFCGSIRTLSSQKQNRRADEATSIIVSCLDCQKSTVS